MTNLERMNILLMTSSMECAVLYAGTLREFEKMSKRKDEAITYVSQDGDYENILVVSSTRSGVPNVALHPGHPNSIFMLSQDEECALVFTPKFAVAVTKTLLQIWITGSIEHRQIKLMDAILHPMLYKSYLIITDVSELYIVNRESCEIREGEHHSGWITDLYEDHGQLMVVTDETPAVPVRFFSPSPL